MERGRPPLLGSSRAPVIMGYQLFSMNHGGGNDWMPTTEWEILHESGNNGYTSTLSQAGPAAAKTRIAQLGPVTPWPRPGYPPRQLKLTLSPLLARLASLDAPEHK